jgi:hypothetical protein
MNTLIPQWAEPNDPESVCVQLTHEETYYLLTAVETLDHCDLHRLSLSIQDTRILLSALSDWLTQPDAHLILRYQLAETRAQDFRREELISLVQKLSSFPSRALFNRDEIHCMVGALLRAADSDENPSQSHLCARLQELVKFDAGVAIAERLVTSLYA